MTNPLIYSSLRRALLGCCLTIPLSSPASADTARFYDDGLTQAALEMPYGVQSIVSPESLTFVGTDTARFYDDGLTQAALEMPYGVQSIVSPESLIFVGADTARFYDDGLTVASAVTIETAIGSRAWKHYDSLFTQ